MRIFSAIQSRRCSNEKEGYARCILILKYMAAVSLFVTFLVFLLFLAPVVPGGYIAAYAQDHCASLCMHLLSPILIYCDLFICDRKREWISVSPLYSALPLLVYFIFILVLGACGFRWRRIAARQRKGRTISRSWRASKAPRRFSKSCRQSLVHQRSKRRWCWQAPK